MFIYGRRRTVITILIGFVFGSVSRIFFVLDLNEIHVEMKAIGFIIPGLIAIWMERQGIIATISAMVIVGILVRLILMIVTGGRI
jgi:hypothetical protein